MLKLNKDEYIDIWYEATPNVTRKFENYYSRTKQSSNKELILTDSPMQVPGRWRKLGASTIRITFWIYIPDWHN